MVRGLRCHRERGQRILERFATLKCLEASLRRFWSGLQSLCCLVCLSIAICGSAFADTNILPSEVRSLQLTYDIFVGGFRAGGIELRARLEANAYELTAITKSAGLIDYLVGFRSYAQTRGVILQRRIAPISHHVNNFWTGDIRFVSMGYSQQIDAGIGPAYTVIHPLQQVDEREIVPRHQRRNTMDPLSAALLSAYSSDGWGGRAPCEDSIPVFDGRRRYNLVFKNAGTEKIDGPQFRGTVRKCLTSLQRIVGFSKNPFLPRSKDLEGGEIWFAELVPSWPAVPVRFKTDIGLGNAFVHLSGHKVQ